MIKYDDIKHLVGIPWVYRETDCWAIFKMASKVIGREVHNLSLPEKSSLKCNIKMFEDEMHSNKWVKSDSPKEGCALVFFEMIGKHERPTHIAFALNDKYILHSMGTTKSVTASSCDKIDSIIKKGFYTRYEVYDYAL